MKIINIQKSLIHVPLMKLLQNCGLMNSCLLNNFEDENNVYVPNMTST